MKIKLAKQLFTLLVLVCLTTVFTGCKKDLADNIVGDWEVTSWKVDGAEALGVTYSSITMEYEELDGDEGDCSWVLSGGGFSETINGTYEVDVEDGEVTVNFSGDVLKFEATVDGDELELEGTISGTDIRIKADRD